MTEAGELPYWIISGQPEGPVRIRSSRVICNGTLYPVVSDHFGIVMEYKQDNAEKEY